MLGLLPAAWSLLGYDSTAHMIEETQEADATAGRSMPYAVGISAISGFSYIFALTLCVQVVLSKIDNRWQVLCTTCQSLYLLPPVVCDRLFARHTAIKKLRIATTFCAIQAASAMPNSALKL